MRTSEVSAFFVLSFPFLIMSPSEGMQSSAVAWEGGRRGSKDMSKPQTHTHTHTFMNPQTTQNAMMTVLNNQLVGRSA